MSSCARTPRALSLAQLDRYEADGFVFPIPVLDAGHVAEERQRFLDYVAAYPEHYETLFWGGRLMYVDTHLFLRWVHTLIAHPRVLAPVQDLLGPNLMVWGSQWFAKFKGETKEVPWHQDAIYDAFDPPRTVTAWIALSDSVASNGCMQIIPGAHHQPFEAVDLGATVHERDAVDITLQPGEMSLHCAGAVHRSLPNHSDRERIGIAVRYISPDLRPLGSARNLAVVVAGEDTSGRFDLIAPPDRDQRYLQTDIQEQSLLRKAQNVVTPFENGERTRRPVD